MAHVLVIDDDLLVSHLLKEHLTNEGHQVTTVHMAEEGFATAVKTSPDLIMLDVNLPDATGFQMCGRLRENPVTRGIPIVMMTGAARFPNQQAIGRQMGANDYILKPFNVVEVGDRIQSLIHVHATNGHVQTIEPPKMNLPDFESAADLLSRMSGDPPTPTKVEIEEATPPLETEVQMEVRDCEEPQIPAEETPLVAAMKREGPLPEEKEQVTDDAGDETSVNALRPEVSLGIFGVLFVLQIGLSIVTSLKLSALLPETIRNATLVAGGWGLLLGLMIATCAILNIELLPRLALQILSWAAVPIVIRSAGILLAASVPSLSHFQNVFNSAHLPTLVFWIRPLDLFETAAVIILGLSIKRQAQCSLWKSLLATMLIALAWCLTGRGYFQPF